MGVRKSKKSILITGLYLFMSYTALNIYGEIIRRTFHICTHFINRAVRERIIWIFQIKIMYSTTIQNNRYLFIRLNPFEQFWLIWVLKKVTGHTGGICKFINIIHNSWRIHEYLMVTVSSRFFSLHVSLYIYYSITVKILCIISKRNRDHSPSTRCSRCKT